MFGFLILDLLIVSVRVPQSCARHSVGGSTKTARVNAAGGSATLSFTGLADGMAKVFDHVGTRDQDSLYILLVFVTALILTVFLFFAEKKRTGKTAQIKDFAAGIAVGIPNYFSSLLLLKSLAAFPAFIVYTIFSTGALMLVSIVGVAFFKEKLQKNHVVGLLMVVIALVLLNVR